jgi:fructosamine-3-kinase
MELAYVTMHGTFARPFFAAYGALAPIDPAFEGRIDLYNIVPNLVHVMLAGPAYIAPIDAALRRHGL